MQTEKLFDDEEQADKSGQTGDEKILPFLPEAYGSQRDQVAAEGQ